MERSGELLVIAGLIGCSVAAAVTEDVHGTDYYPTVRRRAILNVLSVPLTALCRLVPTTLFPPHHRSTVNSRVGREDAGARRIARSIISVSMSFVAVLSKLTSFQHILMYLNVSIEYLSIILRWKKLAITFSCVKYINIKEMYHQNSWYLLIRNN